MPLESTLAYTPPSAPKFSADALLRIAALKRKYSPAVEKITDRVYLARGFALGNVGMIITDEGLVIVDTTESRSVAEEISARFREITDLPIRYIIYTHGHRDHILGTPAFFSQGVQVIATNAAVALMKTYRKELRAFYDRSRANQSGRLETEHSLKSPIKSIFKLETESQLIWPTTTFDEKYTFQLGGVDIELYHTVGETPGHLMIWLPRERILFPGDLYYESFPNLSAPMLEPRPVKGWYESLDRMISMKPAYLVPGHSRAIIGENNVQDILIHHSRAIRFVYEETVKAVNQGLTADEAVAQIRLPPELAQREHLKELYGRVDWSVRGIYQGLTGWYDGRGTGLNPLSNHYLSREVVLLAGGADKLLARAIELQQAGEHQLVCELCDVVIDANHEDKLARVIKSYSLDYLGYLSGNLNMFGFYRSAAAVERKNADFRP
jgi:alkyl sulfatase BDS1-like metallo-beta-lactamase superfamily hydrolase